MEGNSIIILKVNGIQRPHSAVMLKRSPNTYMKFQEDTRRRVTYITLTCLPKGALDPHRTEPDEFVKLQRHLTLITNTRGNQKETEGSRELDTQHHCR
jgi:hypothetical protein